MKIAVACEGNTVTKHFGHCENFIIYDCEGGTIINITNIPTPGHKPGFLPHFLGDLGVNVIISGGMGGSASEIFGERNIKVVTGVLGDPKTAVSAYLKGELKAALNTCDSHSKP